MMNINRSNYEIYFLDYLDGNLPDDQVDYFLDFLKNNPDLNEELKAVSSIKIPANDAVFRNKESLLKNALTESSNFDYRAIAFIEDDLSDEDKGLFLGELTSDSEKEKQFDLFLKLKLQPDTSVVFKDKQLLHKKSAAKIFLYWSVRVAAVLILLFGAWSVWDFSFTRQAPVQVAQQESIRTQRQAPAVNEKPLAGNSEPTDGKGKDMQEREIAINPIQAVQPLVSIPENNPTDELIAVRDQAPSAIEPIRLAVETTFLAEPIALVPMSISNQKEEEFLTIDEYLAEKVLNKKKDQPLTFTNVLSAGLGAVASASNERLSYETNQNGTIAEISLSTRLFAFSIPLKKDR